VNGRPHSRARRFAVLRSGRASSRLSSNANDFVRPTVCVGRIGHNAATSCRNACLFDARLAAETRSLNRRKLRRDLAVDEQSTGLSHPPAAIDDDRVGDPAGSALRLCLLVHLPRSACGGRRAHHALARCHAGAIVEGVRDRRSHVRGGQRDRARHVGRRDPRGATAAAAAALPHRRGDAAALRHPVGRRRRQAARCQHARLGADRRAVRRARLFPGPNRP
jgi:hypothetical protein